MRLSERYFPFYEFQYRIMQKLSPGARLSLYDAMCAYAFDGEELDLIPDDEIPEAPSILWPTIRDLQIETRVKATGGATGSTYKGKLTNKQRFMILERDNFTCQYCGRKAPDVQLNVDHVIPASKGGTNDPENLITSCFECNNGKRAHIIGDDRNWS